MKKIRIGSGAGYAGDRIEPAVELMEKGNLDYIIFECLAERTVAIGQQDKEKDPSKGYNQLLDYRMEKILPPLTKAKQSASSACMPAATLPRKEAGRMSFWRSIFWWLGRNTMWSMTIQKPLWMTAPYGSTSIWFRM